MPSSRRAQSFLPRRYFLRPRFAEVVWTIGKWNRKTSAIDRSLHLFPGAGRWIRELLAFAGVHYSRSTTAALSTDASELKPLEHLLNGKPLPEWLPELPWSFPDLGLPASPPQPEPVILLCPGSELLSETLPPAAWAPAARWLHEWVAPVLFVGSQANANLVSALSQLVASSRPVPALPLIEAPFSEILSRMSRAAGVVGPIGGLTVLSACLGIPTAIGYPPELARIQGLWEPEGAQVVSCVLEELPERLERAELNPGWTCKPPRPREAAAAGAAVLPSGPTHLRGSHSLVAPLGTRDCMPPWAGRAARKPWDYPVTAVIPHLNTLEPLRACVELLRLQTERPYLLIIDTGSPDSVRAALEALRADDLEVHFLRGHAYPHSSEPVAVAQDLAFALCRSEYLFCTHADCFLRRRDYLEWLGSQCDAACPAVGYQMSPRDWLTDQWQGMVSHTATLLHMPTMRRLGVTWSMERARAMIPPREVGEGWPDTETGMNLVLREAGVRPRLIGNETNFERHVDENVDHVRSFPGSQLYAPEYYRQAAEWMEAALQEAWERVVSWGGAEG